MNAKLVGPNSAHVHSLQGLNQYNGGERFWSIPAAFFNIHFSQENKLIAEVDERKGNEKKISNYKKCVWSTHCNF